MCTSRDKEIISGQVLTIDGNLVRRQKMGDTVEGIDASTRVVLAVIGTAAAFDGFLFPSLDGREVVSRASSYGGQIVCQLLLRHTVRQHARLLLSAHRHSLEILHQIHRLRPAPLFCQHERVLSAAVEPAAPLPITIRS